MRGMLIGLALALVALPAWAQTQEQYFWCAGTKFTKDQMIAGCTAIIQSGRYAGTHTLAMAYNNRGWAYHEKGEDAKALPDAEQAVALEPKASRIETRAEIYEKLGRRDQAIADYRAALKLDPNHATAMDGLKRLGSKP
jgi:tetratricopeptide (TPR) repeat protein